MRRSSTTFIIMACLVGAGCSDDRGRTDVVDGADGEGGGHDGDGEGTPILERVGAITRTCGEALRPTQPADRDWFVQAGVAVGEEVWVLRSGSDKLALTQVGTDGTWGTDHPLTVGRWVTSGGAAVARGSEVTLVWVEEATEAGGQALRHAVVDTASGVVVAPHTIEGGTSTYVSAPALVATDEALFMAWGAGQESGRATLKLARLTDTGALEGARPLHAVEQTWNGLQPSMVKAGGALTIVWSAPNAESRYELWMMKVDDAGDELVEPRRISGAAGAGQAFGAAWEAGQVPMLAVGDDVWLVYAASSFNDDFADPEGGVDLRLAIIDPAGEVTTHEVNRHANGVSHTQASLSRMGDHVALTWVQGATIYVCGGCFVDYDIRHVVVDPGTVTPVSAIATHSHDDHGYRRPLPFVLGDRVVTLAAQDFHALSYPTVAVMTCGATP
ncbi:MAG: hypothetical protein IT385_00765 [Deltaproteobacteria bacterium]|nr:hypothetical protein [Deltaproteobacteria bacterium]